uniref:Uncharacterized protein n=1 Tax=Anguilla anguilla TaxID=7936 RepID=A0A0E9U9D6_ANGAN
MAIWHVKGYLSAIPSIKTTH